MNLFNSLKNSVEFVIIDNCSTNLTEVKHLLSASSGNYHLIENSENIGLAAAQNVGIQMALSFNCDHVIFFDQDSVLDANSLLALLKVEQELLEHGFKVGIIGPVCFDPNDNHQYPITKYVGPFIKRKFLADSSTSSASFLISSGSLIRREVLEDVGLMLEDFFIDYIDVEWCYRAQSKGYQLFATSCAQMSHLVGDARVKFFGRTISKHSALRRYYLTRNSIRVLSISHIPLSYKVREIFLSVARILAFFVYSNERLKYSKYMLYAIRDAIFNNYGKARFLESSK